MLRRRARRGQGDDVRDDPLDAAQERRVRAVLALGGVPQAVLPVRVQQVRQGGAERTARGRAAPRAGA
ncbi:RNA polymerase subunit sigma-70, partial [Streptomyces sp. NPDC057387]